MLEGSSYYCPRKPVILLNVSVLFWLQHIYS